MENSTSERHSLTAIKSTHCLITSVLVSKLPSVEQDFITVKLC